MASNQKTNPPPAMVPSPWCCPDDRIENLMEKFGPDDRIKAANFNKAVYDLVLGSKATRAAALEILVEFGDVAEPFCIEVLDGASLGTTEAVLEILKQIGSENLVPSIYFVFASGDPQKRLTAMHAAHPLGLDVLRPLLEKGLDDSDSRVRRKALHFLSWNDASWAVEQIRNATKDADIHVKWAALDILVTLRPSEAYKKITEALPTLEPDERRRAVKLIEYFQKRSSKNLQL